MNSFIHHKLVKQENGYDLILYLDQASAEFSRELGAQQTVKNQTIEEDANHYIKDKLPNIKINMVKIMSGAILVSTLAFSNFNISSAKAAEANDDAEEKIIKRTHNVGAGENLYRIAKKYGTSVDALKRANNLKSDILSIGQKIIIPTATTQVIRQDTQTTYKVVAGDNLYRIAAKYGTNVDALKQANGLSTNTLSIGQTLVIPTSNSPTGTINTTTQNNKSYQVVAGDNLYQIAAKHGTTVDAIKRANNLQSDLLSIGQTLSVPTSGTSVSSNQITTTYTVEAGDNLYRIAAKYGTSVDALKQTNNLTSNILSIGQSLKIPSVNSAVKAQTSIITYTVVAGDNLYRIAQKYGTSVDELKRTNNLSSNILSIGQTLTIPSNITSQTINKTTINQEELQWLAKMIHCEAKGESLEGQIAVGAVILNRVESNLFPNTVKEVIFEKSDGRYQFTPAANGSIDSANPTEMSMEAATRVLNGEDPTNGALYFYNPDKTNDSWIRSRTVSTVIGNHVFSF